MDGSISAQTAAGYLDKMLSGNYCYVLDHFDVYLCNVFDFHFRCFAIGKEKEHRKCTMGKRALLTLSFLFPYQQNINLQLAGNETIW